MEGADLVILNTCHIREKAAEKVYSELGRIRAVKQAREARGLDTMIAVAGCVAQAEGSEILERAQVVDLVVGPQSYHELPALLGRVRDGGERVVATEFPAEDKFLRCQSGRSSAPSLPPSSPCRKAATNSARSASCPIRAAPNISRPSRPSSPRPRGLRGRACARLTLLGQNVNAYRGEGPDGHRLVSRQAAAAARGHSRDRAASLHHEPSARHGRRSDRAAWR